MCREGDSEIFREEAVFEPDDLAADVPQAPAWEELKKSMGGVLHDAGAFPVSFENNNLY